MFEALMGEKKIKGYVSLMTSQAELIPKLVPKDRLGREIGIAVMFLKYICSTSNSLGVVLGQNKNKDSKNQSRSKERAI